MLVERLSLDDVANVSLGEKFYRKIEGMPQETRVALDRHTARKAAAIHIVEKGEQEIEHHKAGYAKEEGNGPFVVLARDDAVEEYLREKRINHTRKRHQQAHHQCEDEGILDAADILAYIM